MTTTPIGWLWLAYGAYHLISWLVKADFWKNLGDSRSSGGSGRGHGEGAGGDPGKNDSCGGCGEGCGGCGGD